MEIFLLKSKIHRATVTGGDVNYEGSLTIPADLMEKCGLQEYEKILCGNMANGNRFETYVIKGRARLRRDHHERRGGASRQEG